SRPRDAGRTGSHARRRLDPPQLELGGLLHLHGSGQSAGRLQLPHRYLGQFQAFRRNGADARVRRAAGAVPRPPRRGEGRLELMDLAETIRERLAALSLCLAIPVWAQTAAKAPASKAVMVNGKPIPKARLDFIVKQRTTQGQPDNDQARKTILDNLITQEVVAQEADRRGFAKTS